MIVPTNLTPDVYQQHHRAKNVLLHFSIQFSNFHTKNCFNESNVLLRAIGQKLSGNFHPGEFIIFNLIFLFIVKTIWCLPVITSIKYDEGGKKTTINKTAGVVKINMEIGILILYLDIDKFHPAVTCIKIEGERKKTAIKIKGVAKHFCWWGPPTNKSHTI